MTGIPTPTVFPSQQSERRLKEYNMASKEKGDRLALASISALRILSWSIDAHVNLRYLYQPEGTGMYHD